MMETLLRLAGRALAGTIELMPADLALAAEDRLLRSLAGVERQDFDPSQPVLRRGRELHRRLSSADRRRPAVLALLSPAPVALLAPEAIELCRHAALAVRELRGRPCRPRFVVDGEAFSGLPPAERGLLSGAARGQIGSWSRLVDVLRWGGEAVLMPSGGPAARARVNMGVREWTRSLRRASLLRGRASDVGRSLQASPSFRRLPELAGGPLPRSPWAQAERWLMAAASGRLPGETIESAVETALGSLVVPEHARPALLSEFLRAMSRDTPPRTRLFKALAERVGGRRPLLFVPVARREGRIAVGECWSWELGATEHHPVRARRADLPDTAYEISPEAFAERFMGESFY